MESKFTIHLHMIHPFESIVVHYPPFMFHLLHHVTNLNDSRWMIPLSIWENALVNCGGERKNC